MQTAASTPIVEDAIARVVPVYRTRLAGIYLCEEPLYDGHEGAEIDFVVVLKGEVNSARQIGVLSEPASDIGLEHSLVVALYPVAQSEFEAPQSPSLPIAKATARRVV
jgi:hypothetical protein